jgi:hypothetical protein
MTDYAYGIADTVPAGHHVILFQNDGPQEHEAVFVKLEAGKTAKTSSSGPTSSRGRPRPTRSTARAR